MHSLVRTSTTPRPRAEALESRRVLAAVQPTAFEQYTLELINRARADPQSEAARLGIDLDEGLSTGSISPAARQPLVASLYLTDAARTHADWLRANGRLTHEGEGGSIPEERAARAGFLEASRDDSILDETLALLLSENDGDLTERVTEAYASLFRDDLATPGADHRLAILDPEMQELGTGLSVGGFGYDDRDDQPAVLATHLFAGHSGRSFLTGVVYTDELAADRFYTPGEGLGGVQITALNVASGARFSTETSEAGGYALELPPGRYLLTATSGARSATYADIEIDGKNVKRDFVQNAQTASPELLALAESSEGLEASASLAKKYLRIDGTEGADAITVRMDRGRVVVTVNDQVMRFDAAKVGRISVYAGDGNDVVSATDDLPGVTLFGGAGNDRISGTNAGDLLVGDSGNDSVAANDGNDTIHGGEGDDYITGGNGADLAYGDQGNDNLVGGAAKNTLYGGDGDDRLTGSGGPDHLLGDGGTDRLYGRGGDDRLEGGGGTDRLYGGDGGDLLTGGSSNDRLFGERGRDTLVGNHGKDYFFGGPDEDTAGDWVLPEEIFEIEVW